MVTRVTVPCPTCQTKISRETWIPYVLFHTTCRVCQTRVTMIHPEYVGKNLGILKKCLDCGDPIPRMPKTKALYRPNVPLFSGLSRTCPSCWTRHRNDEPGGDDVDIFVRRWWRAGLSVAQSAGGTRIAAIGSPQRNA